MRTWLHDSSHAYPEREIPVLAVATIIVTSEAEGHPITVSSMRSAAQGHLSGLRPNRETRRSLSPSISRARFAKSRWRSKSGR